MTDQIIALPTADDVWTDEIPRPNPAVLMAEEGLERAYLCSDTDMADWPVTARLVGAWGDEGEPLTTITSDYEAWIVPQHFKNSADGFSTGPQHSHKWQGHSSHKFYEYTPVVDEDPIVEDYPENNRAYEIKAEWFWQDGTWPGWYIRFTLTLPTGTTDPSVRSISIYDGAWAYQYNLGAWSLTDVDGNYYLDIPAGFQYDPKENVNFAATWASAIEGKMTLPAVDDSVTRLFWKSDT